MGGTVGVIAALVSIAGTAYGAYSASQAQGAEKKVGIPPSPVQIRGDVSNLASRGLGGAAPALLQGVYGQGGQNLDVLRQIQESGLGGAPGGTPGL